MDRKADVPVPVEDVPWLPPIPLHALPLDATPATAASATEKMKNLMLPLLVAHPSCHHKTAHLPAQH
jgi:hypothetical protein